MADKMTINIIPFQAWFVSEHIASNAHSYSASGRVHGQ